MQNMNLTLEIVEIKDVQFGDRTYIQNGVLTINRKELIKEIGDPLFESIDFEIAKPGESTRIIPVKDVIEPRIKVESEGMFPGILDGFNQCGEGNTKVLKGCCLTTTGKIMGFQEGIIDMSGPGAKYCHYSNLINIVLIADPVEGLDPSKHEKAIRHMGLKASLYLAKAGLAVEPDYMESYVKKFVDPAKKLPKVAYANLVMAQGLLHDNEIYGCCSKDIMPMLMHPNELWDGAVISGNCVSASDKNTTYDFQNNPMAKELYKRHDKELDFCGMITSPISTLMDEKERNAALTVNLAIQCGADALIIPQEGGGNPEADLMLICEHAEKRGIKTVIVLHDHPGVDGTAEPMINTSPYATAVVTAGNDSVQIVLPEMERNIGHREQLSLLSGSPSDCEPGNGTIKVGIAVIMGATNNMGVNCNSTEAI